jgi:hypothetical protein
MKTKCPMQPMHFPKEENHQYAPCLEIKPENPLAHPKHISHCDQNVTLKNICLKRPLMDSKAFTFTL